EPVSLLFLAEESEVSASGLGCASSALKRVSQARMGSTLSGSSRLTRGSIVVACCFHCVRSISLISKAACSAFILRVIIPDYGCQRRGFGERVRGKTPRHYGCLDTALREAASGPIAGDRQIVIRVVERRDSVFDRPGQCKHVAIRWVHTGGPILGVENSLARGCIGLA